MERKLALKRDSTKGSFVNYESQFKAKGYDLIVGVDEAGRGPLAGPVVAAAVILKKLKFSNIICDSKKLTSCKREKAFHEILDKAYIGVGIASESVIDRINILNATYFAMSQATRNVLRSMSRQLGEAIKISESSVFLLIDGKYFKTDLPYTYETIVSGDALCLSIACASIVAKVTRDRMLRIYDQIFPEYRFSKHKGYPTREHKRLIKQHGLSLIHRKTFRHAL